MPGIYCGPGGVGWGTASAPLRGLGLLPERFKLLGAGLGYRPALVLQGGFQITKAPLELVIGLAQGGFGIKLQMPGKVDQGKQQIAELFLAADLIGGVNGGLQLIQLFPDLGQYRRPALPVKDGMGGALLQVGRPT